jgi:hypothetical protein
MFDLPPPDPGIEIVVASQGMSKGLRQTDGPQLVIRPELAFGPVFVGASYKNVTSPTADGEVAASIGLRGRAAHFDLSFSAAYKRNTGAGTQPDRDCFELTGSASRRFGRITPRISFIYSPDDLGGTGASLFAEAGASVSVFAGASLSAAIGRRERAGGAEYTAFNAGAAYAITPNFTAELRYYDTAQSRLGAIYEPRITAALRVHF